MQNPEEIDNGSIESSQSEAQFHAPHTGPWGPPGIIAADGTLGDLLWGWVFKSQASALHPALGGKSRRLKNVSRGCFTALSLWLPSLSQMQIMRLNAQGSCVLSAGRGKGPGATEPRCPTVATEETTALPHLLGRRLHLCPQAPWPFLPAEVPP